MTRAVLVPGVLALLPSYAGLTDPVADLRAACLDAVRHLGPDPTILADPQGHRIALSLLDETPSVVEELAQQASRNLLVVANGTACRTEKAPGHLDPRAAPWDEQLGAWLRGHGPRPDLDLGRELLASVDGLAGLDDPLGWGEPEVTWNDDPFGVQYWVMRWP